MVINKPGTVNFWYDPKKNPTAFHDGVNIKWIEFVLSGEHVVIVSEGQTFSVIMNHKTDRELLVFETNIAPDQNKRHMITLTWESSKVCLYFDNEILQEVNPSEVYP